MRYFSKTVYDANKNAVMTSLYDANKIHSVSDVMKENHFLIAVSGWKNTDEMVKLYLERRN